MINETVPANLIGRYGPMVQIGGSLGYLIVFGFGIGLPKGDYNPALIDDP
jgi:hypothetical protein